MISTGAGPAHLTQHTVMSDMDALLLGVERDPQLRSTITVLLALDRPPDRDALIDRLERLSRTIPGFRHRLVKPPLRLSNPQLVIDPDFDISYHVSWTGVADPHTMDAALDFAQRYAMSGLDHDRPLWHMTVLDGLGGGGAVVLVKLHHVLADGTGLLAIAAQILDVERQPRDPGPLPPTPAGTPISFRNVLGAALAGHGTVLLNRLGTLSRGVRALPGAATRPRQTMDEALQNLGALRRLVTPSTHIGSPIMSGRRGWWRFATLEADLDALRRTGKANGGTVNDVFVAAVAQAVARYHDHHESSLEQL